MDQPHHPIPQTSEALFYCEWLDLLKPLQESWKEEIEDFFFKFSQCDIKRVALQYENILKRIEELELEKIYQIQPLLSGKEILSFLEIQSGPIVGKIMEVSISSFCFVFITN